MQLRSATSQVDEGLAICATCDVLGDPRSFHLTPDLNGADALH